MKIKVIVNQHRRDFYAIYVCEHCGFEKKAAGYDDWHFHHNVLPKMTCDACEKYHQMTTSRVTPNTRLMKLFDGVAL